MLKLLTILSSLIILASSQQRGYASGKTFDIFVYQGQYLNSPSNAQYHQNPRTSRGNNYGNNRNNNGFFTTNPFMNFQQGRMFSSPQYQQPFRHMAPPRPSYYYEPRPPPFGKPPPPNHHHPHYHHPHHPPSRPHHNHMAMWPNNGHFDGNFNNNNNYYNTECYDTSTNQAPNVPTTPTPSNNSEMPIKQTPAYQPAPDQLPADQNIANIKEENPNQTSSSSIVTPIPTYEPDSVSSSADNMNPTTLEQNQNVDASTTTINDIISGVFPNFDQSGGNSKPSTVSSPSGSNVNQLISEVFPGLNTNDLSTTTTPGPAISDLLSSVFPSLGQNGQNNNNPFRPTPLPGNGLISGLVSDLSQQPPINPSDPFNTMTSSIPVFQPEPIPRPLNELISGVFTAQTQQDDLPPPPTDPSVPLNTMTSSIPVFQPTPISPANLPNNQESTSTPTTTDSGDILIPGTEDENNDSLLYDIDIRLGIIEEQPKKSNQA